MSEKKREKRRTVLLTGATGGIGREIALKFAENGWNLICHFYSSKRKANKLKKELDLLGAKSRFIQADFASKKDISTFLSKVKAHSIDANSFINNAGTYVANKHFSKLTIHDIIGTFTLNAFTPMLLAIKVFEQMKKRKFGRIINVSSIAAKYGGSSSSLAYGCAKLAVEGMTRTLAREGAKYNVLVNTLRLGVIDTDFHKKFPKDMEKRISMIPMQRMGTAKEAAEMAFYLGSEKNSFITNEIVTVSGGE